MSSDCVQHRSNAADRQEGAEAGLVLFKVCPSCGGMNVTECAQIHYRYHSQPADLADQRLGAGSRHRRVGLDGMGHGHVRTACRVSMR